jgi:hypothetical protein
MGPRLECVSLMAAKAGNSSVVVDEVLSVQVVKQESQRDRRGDVVSGIYHEEIVVAPEHAADITLPSDYNSRPSN